MFTLSLTVIATMSPALGQPVSYDEALALVDENPQVKLAALTLELAQKQRAISTSPVTGQLTGGYTQTWGEARADELDEARDLDETDWEPITLGATFNIVPYGPSFEASLRARWAVERATVSYQNERARAILDISRGYGAALASKLQLGLEQTQLELARTALRQTQTQLTVGAATETQLKQAELALAQADGAVAAATRNLEQALANLSLSLGVTVTDVVAIPPIDRNALNAEAPDPDPLDADTLNSTIQLNARADVLNADLAVQEAILQRDSTLRDYLPSGSLTANYNFVPETGRFSLGASFDTRSFQPSASLSYDPDFETSQAFDLPDLTGQQSSTFSLGLSVTIPFDVRIADALEAGRLNIAQSELQADRALELARLDAKNKALARQDAAATLTLAVSSLEQSELLLEVARERFAAGIIPEQQVSEAELAVQQAELALLNAEHTLRLAQMELAIALALDPLTLDPLEVY